MPRSGSDAVLAMQCRELGGPENLTPTELPDPVAGPGQVVIAVDTAGVNFPDGLIVAGTYQTKPELPFVPGCEVAGTVLSAGPDVVAPAPGTTVTAFCGMGGYAEQVVVPAAMVHPVPDDMDLTHAAVFPVVYGTSYHGLVDQAQLRPGETLLVLGASGGVGLTAVQIGKAAGARVIAAASSDDKLALCAEHGADEVVNYATSDLAAELKSLTSGTGVDVVYDPVGGDPAAAALRRMSWHGRYLTVGYASGNIPKVGMNRLLLTEGSLTGVLWGAWAKRNPQDNADNMTQLLQWYSDGRLRPHVSRSHPLTEAAAALSAVLNREARGKTVLRVREVDAR